jgi:hypothetical protein
MPDACEVRNCRQVGEVRRGAGPNPAAARIPADRAFTDLVPESGELALDAPTTPARVFSRQPYDQIAYLDGNRRTPSRGRVGPAPFDQTAVPVKQRARLHDPMVPQPARHDTGERGEDCPIGPVRSRPGDLTRRSPPRTSSGTAQAGQRSFSVGKCRALVRSGCRRLGSGCRRPITVQVSDNPGWT